MSEEKVLFDPVSYVDRWKMEHEKAPTPSDAEMGIPVDEDPEEEGEQKEEKESDQSVKDSRSKGQKTKKR